MQHSDWRGPFRASLLGLLAKIFFLLSFRSTVLEAMDVEDEESLTQRTDEEVVLTVSAEDRTSDVPTYSQIVVNETSQASHMDNAARAVYPSHLRTLISEFDGVMPVARLGELPHDDQIRLSQLNGVPNRPCTARFSLEDNSVDSSVILDQVVTTGVERRQVKCIQRFRTGMVEVTFASKNACDLFLSQSAIPSSRRRFVFSRQAGNASLFVTIRDAPWELPDKLITDRLEQYGTVLSHRRAFNQALLPERVHDGRRVLRMVLRHDIPSFIKFGPFLVRVYYPGQPKVCWKCSSADHIGRECTSQYCFNCDKCGHLASACDEHVKCSLCKSEEHLAVDCPGNWGRRTYGERTPSRQEEPEPVDNDGMDTDNPDPEADDQQELDPFHSENLSDSSSDEVSDSADEPSSQDTSPLPRQRKRSATKPPGIQKKSRTDENPP